MRSLVLLSLIGCAGTEYGELSVSPSGTGALGLGLVDYFKVLEEVEIYELGDDTPAREARPPEAITVTLHSGSAVEITEVLTAHANFGLRGVEEGTAVVTVTTNHEVSQEVPITVALVADADLFVPRDVYDAFDLALEPARSPVQVFVDSNFVVYQRYRDVYDRPLIGHASLVLDPGSSSLGFDATRLRYTSGNVTGAATISGLATKPDLELAIVDASAIASVDVPDLEQGPIVLHKYFTYVPLLPSDASGRPLVGSGPAPVVSSRDPAIAFAEAASVDTLRAIKITPQGRGTTSIDIQWGGARLVVPVMVQ